MTLILLQFKSNHTPDAISNCAVFQLQNQQRWEAAMTTLLGCTRPLRDHGNLGSSSSFNLGGNRV